MLTIIEKEATKKIIINPKLFFNKKSLDVITDYPDKKSVMMYVMCYFQVLSKPETEIKELSNNSEVILFFNPFFRFIFLLLLLFHS